MRPLRLGLGHALHAVDAGFELQPGEHAWPVIVAMPFLEAAEAGLADAQDLEAPAVAVRHSAGTCGTARRRTAPPPRRRCRRALRGWRCSRRPRPWAAAAICTCCSSSGSFCLSAAQLVLGHRASSRHRRRDRPPAPSRSASSARLSAQRDDALDQSARDRHIPCDMRANSCASRFGRSRAISAPARRGATTRASLFSMLIASSHPSLVDREPEQAGQQALGLSPRSAGPRRQSRAAPRGLMQQPVDQQPRRRRRHRPRRSASTSPAQHLEALAQGDDAPARPPAPRGAPRIPQPPRRSAPARSPPLASRLERPSWRDALEIVELIAKHVVQPVAPPGSTSAGTATSISSTGPMPAHLERLRPSPRR